MFKNLSSRQFSLRQVLVILAAIALLFGAVWAGKNVGVISYFANAESRSVTKIITPLSSDSEFLMEVDRYEVKTNDRSWTRFFTIGYKSNSGEWRVLVDAEYNFFDPEEFNSSQPTVESDIQFDFYSESLEMHG